MSPDARCIRVYCYTMATLLLSRTALRPSVSAKANPRSQQSPPGALLTDKKTEAFVQWCLSNLSVTCDKLTPAVFGGIRGMAASKPIALEDLLISIPRSSAISLAPKQRCPCPDFVTSDYWGPQPWFVKLAVMLLYERSLGSKSRLSAYIEQLPSSFEHPVLWTPRQREQLQYPHIIDKVSSQRREWEELYRKFAAGQRGTTPVSLDQFLWALCAVRSRTFSGPYIGTSLADRIKLAGFVAVLAVGNITLGLADAERTLSAAIAVFTFNVLYEVILSRNMKQYAMAPLMDFINHSNKVQSEVSLDYFTDKYTVTAGKAFAQGEQVFISYGAEQTSDSLLMYYGFVEPDNTKDVYYMTRLLQWLPAHITLPQARMQKLEQAGLKTALDQVKIARTGFPATTLQALRYLLADDRQSASGPESFSGAGSDVQEARLAEVLAAVCLDELKALGTSLSEDQALSSSSGGKRGLSNEDVVAIQFRVEKKKVLGACLASLGVQVTPPTPAGTAS